MNKYIRVLEWYNKTGCDIRVGKEDISSMTNVFLKEILDVGDEDDAELFGCYMIEDFSIKKIQKHIKHKINTKKYDYFIGTYQA